MPIPSPINPATGGKTRKEVGRCKDIAPSSLGEGICSGVLATALVLLDDASAMIMMSKIENGVEILERRKSRFRNDLNLDLDLR